ncbi:kinase-like protein [Metschnikowia bicuspidata var. bicuspidata NRRL YB-4993]|uniref:Kinase-like protein n=1 Tax=Metschnikowia bicuspidata var. bicuspidata NRRL YB-4993 TaxID=869754 RepID=A0A1A0HCG7_9ASCO|nr:kinase-like protein [Metschnikowia bicuspidata var. bicuspidata NRRL YB-4993]OBA21603.1 kinase-like protein [Metschnikowia bicuspidata var. bicuspidata NRRL YB-4993]
MTEIFPMDGYEAELVAGVSSLNYRLLEDKHADLEEPVSCPKTDSEPSDQDSNDSDVVTELLARPVPAQSRSRRRSSVSKYSSSYELDIHELFVSLTLVASGHRPKLADFEPIKVLGHGSYGKVLLVREKSSGRLFAQKQLKKALLVINETNEVHQKNYERTINEKAILEKVNHPNVVKLYYAFQDNNKVYLILEYLDGGEIFHHLAQQRYLSEKDASFYIAQIVLALRYLHSSLKVIYRDLKPENCMLNSAGHLVLTDFGLSKFSSDDADANHLMIGTAQYMAPEVIKGEDYDFRVDWWSLGCVAFDMLTGGPPFTGHTNDKIMDKIVHSKKHLKFPFYLSHDAKDLLRKLLQPSAAKRFDVDVDYEEFKQHRFFRHIDWKVIEQGCAGDVLPPILPVITDPILAENFDEEFTTMQFTPPAHDPGVSRLPDEVLHVKGFTFTNESFLASVLGAGLD